MDLARNFSLPLSLPSLSRFPPSLASLPPSFHPCLIPSVCPSFPPSSGVAQILRGSYFGAGNMPITVCSMQCFEFHVELIYSRQTNIADCRGFTYRNFGTRSYSCIRHPVAGVRCIGEYIQLRLCTVVYRLMTMSILIDDFITIYQLMMQVVSSYQAVSSCNYWSCKYQAVSSCNYWSCS